MQQVIILDRSNFDNALKSVRELNTGFLEQRGMHTINEGLDGTMLGKISEVWDLIESTLKKAYTYGKEFVTDTIDNVNNAVETLLKEAGHQVQKVQNNLLTRVKLFMKNLIDGAINLIPEFVIISDKKFSVSKVSWGQKIVLGGSLKANILEAIEISSNGEFNLSIEYATISDAKIAQ
jgi:hypothetical protein